MAELDAWTAGIIDGEGCIAIETLRGELRRLYPPLYRTTIRVSNTDIRMLNKLKELWGGNIRPFHNRHPEKWKQAYEWMITNKSAIPVLKAIMPYLVCKKEQAILALELQERVTARLGVKKIPIPSSKQNTATYVLAQAEQIIRESLQKQIKPLNKRGVK